jgi:hypothetical protein
MLLENVHEERKNVGFRKGGSQPFLVDIFQKHSLIVNILNHNYFSITKFVGTPRLGTEERKNVGFRKGGSQPLALRLSVANGRDQILRVTRSPDRQYSKSQLFLYHKIRWDTSTRNHC